MINMTKLAGALVKVLDGAMAEGWSPGDLVIVTERDGPVFIWQVGWGETYKLVGSVRSVAEALALVEAVRLKTAPKDDNQVLKEQVHRRQLVFLGEEARLATRNRILEEFKYRGVQRRACARKSDPAGRRPPGLDLAWGGREW